MIRVFAQATSRPGCTDQLRAVLGKLAKASRVEAGVLTYEVYESKEAGVFLFREEYDNQQSFELHKRSRHVAVAFARATPLIQGQLNVWVAELLNDE